MFSLDTNVLRHSVMVAPDILAVIVEVRILLSQQILTLNLTNIVLVMKTIEERASLAAWQIYEETILPEHSVNRVAEIIEEKMLKQKKIDIDKACNIFCHTGCPHKADSYNCLNDKCDAWKAFRRMMEE